ncbi:hypothetical protein M3Y99_01987500 [Aphelenchoides fujianensis]|nr:hypothetical protein M3Y99_01987500 [Aphelenchoides fujianensis]
MTSANSPIVQLSSKQLCGCAKCWKTAVLSPRYHLAVKKPKQTAVVIAQPDHKRQGSKNSFVYDMHEILDQYTVSTDGRYLYVFTTGHHLLIVDLTRNEQTIMKPLKPFESTVMTYVVVNSTTIVASTCHEDGGGEVLLLRLDASADLYDYTRLFEDPHGVPTFVLTEINGREVDVKRTVLQGFDGFVFLRVDIDKPEANVEHTAELPEGVENSFYTHMSDDGREMFVIDEEDPKTLHVYKPQQEQWSKEKLGGADVGPKINIMMRSPQLYAEVLEDDFSPTAHSFVRCNVQAKMWEKVAIDAKDVVLVSPILNPAEGEEDGVVVIRSKKSHDVDNSPLIRIKVERHMFRATDSLQRQAFMAARKLREGVAVEKTLRQAVAANKRRKQVLDESEKSKADLQKKFFPSVYEGMELIPVCDLQ